MIQKGGSYNPVFPFSIDVLEKSIERGCRFFVRNAWPAGFDHFHHDVKPIIFTHYNEEDHAKAHFQAVLHDPFRHIYDIQKEDDLNRLKIAANQPAGYKIFSSYFRDDYKRIITKNVKEKINRWMYRNTDWQPKKGQTLHVDFYLKFGKLFCTLSFQGRKIQVTFDEIDNC